VVSILFHSTGTLIYDPKRDGLKSNTDWWIILKIDPNIINYYRWHILKHTGFILNKPAWGAHISVVKGERPKYTDKWKLLNFKRINFQYSNIIRWSGDTSCHDVPYKFWFIDAWSNDLVTIRSELGYYNFKNHKFHITVGTLY
jgi:hypothetical protein